MGLPPFPFHPRKLIAWLELKSTTVTTRIPVPVSGSMQRLKKSDNTWTTKIPVYPKLPLYVFGHCTYHLDQEMTLQVGSSTTFSINSKEAIHEPGNIDLRELSKLARTGLIEDFSNGTIDWASRNGDSITTYKLQSPMIKRSNDKVLAFTIDPQEEIILFAFVWEVHSSVVKTTWEFYLQYQDLRQRSSASPDRSQRL